MVVKFCPLRPLILSFPSPWILQVCEIDAPTKTPKRFGAPFGNNIISLRPRALHQFSTVHRLTWNFHHQKMARFRRSWSFSGPKWFSTKKRGKTVIAPVEFNVFFLRKTNIYPRCSNVWIISHSRRNVGKYSIHDMDPMGCDGLGTGWWRTLVNDVS